MKIRLAILFVLDQDQALRFYTEILGFVKKAEFPVGQFKWLTVVSADELEGTQLTLQPNNNPAAEAFRSALHAQGLAATSFAVDDVQKEYERLNALGVVFTKKPTPLGPTVQAVFDDTCGNLIQIAQMV